MYLSTYCFNIIIILIKITFNSIFRKGNEASQIANTSDMSLPHSKTYLLAHSKAGTQDSHTFPQLHSVFPPLAFVNIQFVNFIE